MCVCVCVCEGVIVSCVCVSVCVWGGGGGGEGRKVGGDPAYKQCGYNSRLSPFTNLDMEKYPIFAKAGC